MKTNDTKPARMPKLKSHKKYKDTLIKFLFRDPKRAIELCNVITSSNYPEDVDVVACDLWN